VRRVLEPSDPERRLTPAAKALLGAEVLGTYARVRRLLRRHDLPAVVAAIEAKAPAVAPASRRSAPFRVGVRLARSSSRCLAALPTDSRCLTRSLVLMALLARRGVASKLVIGVRPGDDFAAHAWLERDGRPLLPPGGETYARLLELGSQSGTAAPA
jgi:hypothetical protein